MMRGKKKRRPSNVQLNLSLAHRNLKTFPKDLSEDKMLRCVELDVSHNSFCSLNTLIGCDNIQCLVADHNSINSHVQFPYMPNLKRLWLNHNNIDNLVLFIETISRQFPNLVELNLMNNPAAPSYLNGGSVKEYQDYRNFVISRLPKLQHLDFAKISREERRKAIASRA